MVNLSACKVPSDPQFTLSKMERGQQSFVFLMRNHDPTFIFSSVHRPFLFSCTTFSCFFMFESISQSANQSACREVVLYTNSRNGGINSGDGGRNCSSSGSKIITSLECLLCARHHSNPLTFQSIIIPEELITFCTVTQLDSRGVGFEARSESRPLTLAHPLCLAI